MALGIDKYHKRRLISSYFSVIVSISLVLFLLGLLGILILNASAISTHFKERVVMSIYLEDNTKQIELEQLQNSFVLNDAIKSVRYIPKEDAAEQMKTEYGEDFLNDIGYNPLQNAIDLNLRANYVNAEFLDNLTDTILSKPFVEEVRYDKDLVSLMNKNVKRISVWVLSISAIFTLIAVLLINSSIRLSVYSKRFIIKTMQMVGATKRFIRRPFIWQSVKLGLIGALIALSGLAIILVKIDRSFPELKLLNKPLLPALLFLTVFLLGLVITWFSTFFATQRYLNLKTDQLYGRKSLKNTPLFIDPPF